MKQHYIYALIDPRDNKIRYIGKTCGSLSKRLSGHYRDKGHTHKTMWIKNLKNDNLKPLIKSIGTYDESIVNGMEIFWIDYFKRCGCKLTNMTIGGESGFNGGKHSEESRQKIGEYWKGRKLTEEHRKIMSETHKGKTISEEHKEIIRETWKRRKEVGFSEETLAKMRIASTGRKPTEETLAKMRIAAKEREAKKRAERLSK
jgi:hypothetical protein